MENNKIGYSKIAILSLAIWVFSLTNFLVVFSNILVPLIPSLPLTSTNFFSTLITQKLFSLFSSLFLLSVFCSMIIAIIAKKQIRIHRKRGKRIAQFVISASIIEIILFILLLILYLFK